MTAFPGITVEQLELTGMRAGDRASGGEIVPGGVTRDFDFPQRAEDITPESIQEFVEEASDMIDLVGDEYELEYDLAVRAVSKLGAKGKARAFARTKNPFEVDLIQVSEPQLDERMSNERVARYYNVTATVTKE